MFRFLAVPHGWKRVLPQRTACGCSLLRGQTSARPFPSRDSRQLQKNKTTRYDIDPLTMVMPWHNILTFLVSA